MDQPCVRLPVKAAAAADIRVTWFHPGKTVKALSIQLWPNATSGTHASNYADVKVYIGSTQVGATRSTNSSTGTALTLNTLETLDISATATPTVNQISSTSPLSIRTTNAASGVAIDVDYQVLYEEIR